MRLIFLSLILIDLLTAVSAEEIEAADFLDAKNCTYLVARDYAKVSQETAQAAAEAAFQKCIDKWQAVATRVADSSISITDKSLPNKKPTSELERAVSRAKLITVIMDMNQKRLAPSLITEIFDLRAQSRGCE